MPEPAYLAMMKDHGPNPILATQDAAEALIALGWPVTPPSRSQPRWQVGKDLLTTTELLVFAAFVVIVPQVKRSRR